MKPKVHFFINSKYFLFKKKLVWFGKYYMQIIFYFPKGFTSVCLRISTRYQAIFINAYFDLT